MSNKHNTDDLRKAMYATYMGKEVVIIERLPFTDKPMWVIADVDTWEVKYVYENELKNAYYIDCIE